MFETTTKQKNKYHEKRMRNLNGGENDKRNTCWNETKPNQINKRSKTLELEVEKQENTFQTMNK